ncbi:MAG: hypothetical protein KY428_10920, partial [Bacteroidetes bacterium]|nr:hypothetical protein [Bacteroidota bacterium]
EFEGFFKNPTYSLVLKAAGLKKAGDLGRNRWESQVKDIVRIHNKYKGWENFVNEHTPDLDKADKEKIVKMMYTRSAALIEFVKSLPREPKPEKKPIYVGPTNAKATQRRNPQTDKK